MSKRRKNILGEDFFRENALSIAPSLLGCEIFRRFDDGAVKNFMITEVEAYGGEEDLACHASKGRTKRTSTMYQSGGHVYVYLIYGMHWMLNIVTAEEGSPQAVLIRGLVGCNGPGRLTKLLKIDGSLNGSHLDELDDFWIEKAQQKIKYNAGPRIGVDYAGDYWSNVPWRFWIEP
ncbi:MAG TPA: 3-methyladenine DNA glycosylase [Bacteroidales bacterium]|jgi:DNA-3-methyladenine glycosylase|nr:3-methyladenine DNA glycosylase [Bacteroidales bacterium]